VGLGEVSAVWGAEEKGVDEGEGGGE